METKHFILGVGLDGVVSDFHGYLRTVAAEWRGVKADELPAEVSHGLPEWGFRPDTNEYLKLHHFAVDQRGLFLNQEPIPGALQALRHLSDEGIRIRIITHRLLISHAHLAAVEQTVRWLDGHGVSYWDVCFMAAKGGVGADLYIEDSPTNVAALRDDAKKVIIFTNSTNRQVLDEPGGRVDNWDHGEKLIHQHYYTWLTENGLPKPPGPGLQPPKSK